MGPPLGGPFFAYRSGEPPVLLARERPEAARPSRTGELWTVWAAEASGSRPYLSHGQVPDGLAEKNVRELPVSVATAPSPLFDVAHAPSPPFRNRCCAESPYAQKRYLGKRAESPCSSRQKGGLGEIEVLERGTR